MFLLDTNICIYIIKKKPFTVFERLKSKRITEVAVSSITLAELQFGVEKSQHKERNQLALNQFLAPLEILSFDAKAAQYFGKIRSELEKEGKPIGVFDMMIAAHALSLEATLITNNEKEFSRIKYLKMDNWAE